MPLTVGEFKKMLDGLPDDIPMGTTDQFGEFVPFEKHEVAVTDNCWNHRNPAWFVEFPSDKPDPN